MSNKNLAAVFIGFVMILWLFSGSLSSNLVSAEVDTKSQERALPLVRAQLSRASMQNLELEVRGITQPNRLVAVRAEISGKVEAIPAVKGTRVDTGDLLCQIAVDTRQSDLNEAKSELKRAELEHQGLVDLGKQGLHSRINIAKAKATLESSKSRLKRAELALKKTAILAPFAGTVSSQPVEIGDFMSPGKICVSLIELDPLLIEGQVAEKNIDAIKLGNEVEVKLITGQELTGTVTYIAYAPEDETRSYSIEVTIKNPQGAIRSGLTSEMNVPLGSQEAHLISPASLVLNDAGQIGVRIVDEQNIVQFYTVNILKEGKSGIWIGGLPPEIKLITVGQEEVFEGQAVRMDLSPLSPVGKITKQGDDSP